MPQIHLTDLAIQRLPASDSYVTYWDQALPAFGIRIGKRSRTFVIMKGTERKRISLGRYPALTLKDARQKAYAFCSAQYIQAPASTAPSAQFAVDQFLQSHAAKIRSKTLHETKRVLLKHFSPRF